MFQKWPEGFAGFRARLCCETPRGAIEGRVAVLLPDRVEAECADAEVRLWLADTLRAIARQRTPRFFHDGDGRFPISFAPGAADDAGRAVDVHCRRGQLRYWINGRGRIVRVERVAQGLRAVTTFEELVRATPGRVLPARSSTITSDAATGALLHAEAIVDAHRRVDHVWLPASRRIGAAGAPGRQLTLDDHQLL
jgi:hypothetical protein